MQLDAPLSGGERGWKRERGEREKWGGEREGGGEREREREMWLRCVLTWKPVVPRRGDDLSFFIYVLSHPLHFKVQLLGGLSLFSSLGMRILRPSSCSFRCHQRVRPPQDRNLVVPPFSLYSLSWGPR